MDQDLSELERRASANPEDRELAERLDRALLRAGREEQVQERYRFKFRCPRRFEDLAFSNDPAQRSCDRCQRSVHFVRTPEELRERTTQGECVAIHRDSLAAGCLELALDPQVSSAEEPLGPCVHETTLRYVDLDRLEIPPAVLERIPASFAHTYQVVPIAFSPVPPGAPAGQPLPFTATHAGYPSSSSLDEPIPRLEIACASTSTVAPPGIVVEDLEFMLDLQITLALADPEAVLRAVERYYPDPGSAFEDGNYLGETIPAA